MSVFKAFCSPGLIAMFAATSCAAQAPPITVPADPAGTQVSAPAPRQPAASDDVSTNDLLDRMYTVGHSLTSLDASVEMETTDNIAGNTSARTGTFLLQRMGDGDSRARVKFERLVIDDGEKKKIIPEKIEYLLEGDWVTDRVYGRSPNDPGGRRETHRQIRKPGEKVDLLKLGEGPFPLPIGQTRDAVRAQFEVTRLPDDKDKPGLIGLELRPHEETRMARRFHQIIIWVDAKDAMPRVIETVSAEMSVVPDPEHPGATRVQIEPGPESKKTTLGDVKINAPVTDADFKLEPVDESTWTIVREEYKE